MSKSDKKCNHYITKGKIGEKGSWCVFCGKKILDVNKATCQYCKYSKKIFNGWVCAKFLMFIQPDLNATFKVENGTCFKSKSS